MWRSRYGFTKLSLSMRGIILMNYKDIDIRELIENECGKDMKEAREFHQTEEEFDTWLQAHLWNWAQTKIQKLTIENIELNDELNDINIINPDGVLSKETALDTIELWGVDAQMKQVLEELNELETAIFGIWRGKTTPYELQEEIADVYIMLAQLLQMFPWATVKDVEQVIIEKRMKLTKLIRDAKEKIKSEESNGVK